MPSKAWQYVTDDDCDMIIWHYAVCYSPQRVINKKTGGRIAKCRRSGHQKAVDTSGSATEAECTFLRPKADGNAIHHEDRVNLTIGVQQ